MNRRKRKKQFKKRFGFNPPRNISIQKATWIMERREKVIATFMKIKEVILDLWECLKKPLQELADRLEKIEIALISERERKHQQYVALADFQTKALLQQRQQESEVMQFESNFNIYNHDRR